MSLSLYLYALRAARGRQLLGRATRPARRRLFPRAAPSGSPRPLDENVQLWRSSAFERRASEPTGTLLEFVRSYGEDVLEAARAGAGSDARVLAERWVRAEPPRVGAPWHPYVVSTRIANWVAAASLEPAVASECVNESLRLQTRYLMRNVEDDVLGNHVIRNAKALVLAGVAFGDNEAFEQGRLLLERELPEQVLDDGGHYERSPAYHRLVLLDLLEVEPYVDVERPVAAMTGFASASSRPDGAPALFNDGGVDVAPALSLPRPADGIDVRATTGYVFVRRGRVWLAFDCGPPAPDFLPAHAHADALSFQLWLDGKPVVVDPGTSTYERGAARNWERGSAAHSVVAVDGDQFRLWGSFRSGPLPRVSLLEATERELVGEAVLPSGVSVRRSLRLDETSLTVEDRVLGTGTHDLTSSIPLAPAATARVSASESFDVEERTIAERFGELVASTGAVMRVRANFPWEGSWRVEWES